MGEQIALGQRPIGGQVLTLTAAAAAAVATAAAAAAAAFQAQGSKKKSVRDICVVVVRSSISFPYCYEREKECCNSFVCRFRASGSNERS